MRPVALLSLLIVGIDAFAPIPISRLRPSEKRAGAGSNVRVSTVLDSTPASVLTAETEESEEKVVTSNPAIAKEPVEWWEVGAYDIPPPAFAAGDPGVTEPFTYWDPLGLAKNEEVFKFYRRAEVKHCRVAMLACIGYALPYLFKFQGYLSPELNFADIPNGIAALQAIPGAGVIQLLFFIGFLDNIPFLFKRKVTLSGVEAEPKIELYPWPEDPEKKRALAAREINNGRLAMFGIMGLIAQDLISDQPFPFLST